MSRRHRAIVALSLSATALLTAGCSDDVKATSQAIFDGRLERAGGMNCQDVGPLFNVGEFGNPALETASSPIADGEPYEQGTVNVTCSVVPSGTDEFRVKGAVGLTGATGGMFHVEGTFTTTGEQEGISAVFTRRLGGNSYTATGCTVRYTTPSQGIAAGRVWGEILCPAAENASAQTECKAVAQFRFENCEQ